jgi:hypothetical protein
MRGAPAGCLRLPSNTSDPMQPWRWIQFVLWSIAAGSGVALMARAVLGPYRLILPVTSPLNAESFFALSVLVLLAVRSRRGSDSGPHRREPRIPWAIWVLIGAGIAAWAWSARFPFIADDYILTSGSPLTSGSLERLFTTTGADRFFRPFGYVAYALGADAWGTNRIAWHSLSLFLHVLNSTLVFLLAVMRGYRRWGALIAALIFLLGGSKPEAVAWVAAQWDLWATLFFLVALIAFLHFVKTRDGRWEIASLAALLLALLSKESAYAYPLAAVLALWLDGVRGKECLRLSAPPLAMTLVVFLYRWSILGDIGGYRAGGTGGPSFYSVDLFRTAKAFFMRLPAVLAFPINWAQEPEWWLFACLLAAIAGLGVAASARPRREALWFAMGFLTVSAIPVHLFLLIGSNLEKSRVLYLPSVGFALLVAAALEALRIRAALAAACAILALQTAALEHNLRIWRGVAQLAENTCADVAQQVQATLGAVLVSDAPNDIEGVYFLGVGFRPCIEWAAGKRLENLFLMDDPAAVGVQADRFLWWNGDHRTFEIRN